MDSNNNQKILKTPTQKFEKSIFSFRRTHEEAVSNSKTFAAFKGDLCVAIAEQKDSSVNYGSEFHDILYLEKLLFYHKDKTNIINIIHKGYHYHLDPIKEEALKSYLDVMILRGNHKSSHSELNSDTLEKSIKKYIDYVWSLPLTI